MPGEKNMNEKIQALHLSRLAVVYKRQSNPMQARDHLESPLRQLALAKHAEELGWSPSQVLVLDEQPRSASCTEGRSAFRQLRDLVVAGKVGVILAVDVSRWARDTVAWQLLLRDCVFEGVLLADECRVYDPNDSHDHVLLGIQGVLAEHELRRLQERTTECWWNKARRHEMVFHLPTGIVCVDGKITKHPHRRVRHSFDRLFAQFDRCSSVLQLCQWYLKEKELLPFVVHGDNPEHVQWRAATYYRLVGILKNPTYAGAYVIGRTKTIQIRNEQGEIVRRRRLVCRDKWEVVQRQHFDGYITWEKYEQNLMKIEKNTRGAARSGGAVRGSGLLSGLLRCGRCGSSLQVRYLGRQGHPTYMCRGGARQREQSGKCLSFFGPPAESLFSEMVLEVVRPAALAAATQARTRFREQSQQDRQVLLDHLQQLEYEVERARRQYDRVEPENRLVAQDLEGRWNTALQAVDVQRVRLQEFDQQHPPMDCDESFQTWFTPQRLEQIWNASSSDTSLKKQIVDLLVREVIVNLSESGEEVQLWIHWQGGHHTLLTAPHRTRCSGRIDEVQRVISQLRCISDDASIARTLNRHGIALPNKTKNQVTNWTAKSVRQFRERHAIAPFDAAEKVRRGLLTADEAAQRLEISPMSVHRLVAAGILPSAQPQRGLPSVIHAPDLELPKVQKAAQRILANLPRPLPENPNQQKLF
jgi:DNA invertase Pin-like site-specific DNA recombinase